MFFEVLSPIYHSPITIDAVTYRRVAGYASVLVQTRVFRMRQRSALTVLVGGVREKSRIAFSELHSDRAVGELSVC
jgi:hypothetical protein